MRIGIITGEYPPMEGGVGDYTRELSSALCKLGHRIDILTSSTEDMPLPKHSNFQVRYAVNNWGPLGAYPIIQNWLRDFEPDIINIQYQAAAYQMKGGINFLPKVLALQNKPPVVVTYHDLLPPYLFPKAGYLRDWSVRFLARHSKGVIVTNEDDKYNLHNALGQACAPLRLIPIGSNIATQPPEGFDSKIWRMEKSLSNEDLVIGFFGFLNRNKGVEILLSAIAKLHDAGVPVKLLFVGGRTGSSDITNTSYADDIDALIDSLGIQHIVLKTGFVPAEEVSAALLSIDICALPFLEGASFRHGTLHAALNHGCAIITTQPIHKTDMLENGSVHLVPINNATALEQAIKDIWENRPYLLRLKEKALELSKRFTWDRIAADTAYFYSQCLD